MAEMKTLTINDTLYDGFVDKKARESIEKQKPLLLNADDLASYNTDPVYGDEALEAIIAGRQILVRTPTVSGDSYVENYSPVYMYQVPNVNNNYLYLFYLRDEKQTIDLSAIGLGQVQMPVYAELKMKLSQTYTECPLK